MNLSSATPFTAILLAGGRSTRMGRDKAWLPLADGRTLFARQFTLLRDTGAAEVLVSARPEQSLPLAGARLIPDIQLECGPLAGLVTALAAAAHDRVLVLAIDLARMPAEYLAGLVAAATADVGVVPWLDGEPEPLAAVYPRVVFPLASAMLAAGERRPREWARQLAVRGSVQCCPVLPAEAGWFENWNTPHEAGLKSADSVRAPRE